MYAISTLHTKKVMTKRRVFLLVFSSKNFPDTLKCFPILWSNWAGDLPWRFSFHSAGKKLMTALKSRSQGELVEIDVKYHKICVLSSFFPDNATSI
jgi:hypothetical protein